MALHHIWLIPFLTCFFTLAAFITSYIMAVSKGHVQGIWPFISDGGAMPPESCVFAQLLNIAALFLACSVYLRHRQLVEFYWHAMGKTGRWRIFCNVFLVLGYISAFGVSLVANFQETNVIQVHYTGAFMAFFCGLIYLWAQTIFSYRMTPKMTACWVARTRLALVSLSTAFFIIGFIAVIFCKQIDNEPKWAVSNKERLRLWTSDMKAYPLHIVSTVSEWLLAICFQFYVLSFAVELRKAYCHAPKLKLEGRLAQSGRGGEDDDSTAGCRTTSTASLQPASRHGSGSSNRRKSMAARLGQVAPAIDSIYVVPRHQAPQQDAVTRIDLEN